MSKGSEPTVCGVRLSSTDLEKSKLFWSSLAKMNTKIEGNTLTAKYENSPIWVEFEKVNKINPEDNYGRTAIAWPTDGLKQVEEQGKGSIKSSLCIFLDNKKTDFIAKNAFM